MYPRYAELDVHKDSVVARVRRHDEGGSARNVVQTCGTTTTAWLALGDWLGSHGCTHVAMEATGVYWKPVWHLLENAFLLVLANAMHIKHVPGRKTDVNDATWIADLFGPRADPRQLRATGRLAARGFDLEVAVLQRPLDLSRPRHGG